MRIGPQVGDAERNGMSLGSVSPACQLISVKVYDLQFPSKLHGKRDHFRVHAFMLLRPSVLFLITGW